MLRRKGGDNLADLGSAIEKLKEMMSTPDGQANIQNIVANFGGGNVDTSNLAGMLGNFAAENSNGDNGSEMFADNGDSNSNHGNFSGFDPDMMLKMQKMMSMMNGSGGGAGIGGSNRHANMLNSLKPYLSDGRKGKLDMASKMMSLAKFAPLIKDL